VPRRERTSKALRYGTRGLSKSNFKDHYDTHQLSVRTYHSAQPSITGN